MEVPSTNRSLTFLIALLLLLTAFSGCSQKASAPTQAVLPASQQTAPAQSGAAPPQSTPPAASAPSGTVLASAQFADNPDLRCDLLEVKRISGGALMARWRLINTGAKPVGYDFAWGDIYYVDPAGNKKYSYLTDSEGKRIIDVWYGTLNPGDQHLNWAKFPAPPADSKKISLNVPRFAPFEDVSVAE